MPNIIRTKCAIVGDSKVGKTALTQMFLTNGRAYPKNYNMTLGVDLTVKTIKIPDTEDTVEMYLYDSSGRDIYTPFLTRYWHMPNIILVVYDVTSKPSFDSVTKWLDMAKNAVAEESQATTPCVLFGNKTDLVERRVVSPKAGSVFAEKLGLHYMEGSAKDNLRTEEPFYVLAHEWHKLYEMAQGDQ